MTALPRQQTPSDLAQWVADHRRLVLSLYAALALGSGALGLWNFIDDGWAWIVTLQFLMFVGFGATSLLILRMVRAIDRYHHMP